MQILRMFSSKPQEFRIMRGPFRGARMFLNPRSSKRKIFGLYEHCLNSWLTEIPARKDFAFDVGSNTGYDLFGLAYLMSGGNTRETTVVGFEPEASKFPELAEPRGWADYSKCQIEIIEKFAGKESCDSTVTLDDAFHQRPGLAGRRGLIKIDVEGAEVDVLAGARQLLDDPAHDWLIEIHGADLIPDVCSFFVERSRSFLVKDLPAIPLLGKERRSIDTYWLVTINGERSDLENCREGRGRE